MISMPSCRKCMFPQYLWRGIGPNISWPKDRAVAKRSTDISSKVDQGRVKVPKQLQRSKVDPGFRPGEYLLLLNNNCPSHLFHNLYSSPTMKMHLKKETF